MIEELYESWTDSGTFVPEAYITDGSALNVTEVRSRIPKNTFQPVCSGFNQELLC